LCFELRQVRIEVGAPRNGRPGYRWTAGYYVRNPLTGFEEAPPLRRAEAYARVREIAAGRPHSVVIKG
jgi:hypothetical protein